MAKYKATYTGSTPYEKNYYNQHWNYRGHDYIVTVPTSWNCSLDYLNNGYMSQKNQHKRAQESIDAMIDNPIKEEPKKQKYEGSWEEGFDILWNYINQ